MKRFISIAVMIVLCLSVITFHPDFSVQADAATSYSFVTVENGTVESIPESPVKMNVIMIGEISDNATKRLLYNLSNSDVINRTDCRFIYVDFYGKNRETMTAFAADYSPDIVFTCGSYQNFIWSLPGYYQALAPFPIVMYVNNDGDRLKYTSGETSSDEIANNLKIFIDNAEMKEFTTVNIYGYYFANIQEALDRINEIRYEACAEGIRNPAPYSSYLTLQDYHPVEWSAELEEYARLRAAEASIRGEHVRPNGKNWSTAAPDRNDYLSESIAFVFSPDLVDGINAFYSEKELWVSGSNDTAATGHYQEMINPLNYSVGVGGFYSEINGSWPSNVCAWYSRSSSSDRAYGSPTDHIEQQVEIKTSALNDPFIAGSDTTPDELTVGSSFQFQLKARAVYDEQGCVLLRKDVEWVSSDPDVLSVSSEGLASAKAPGTATISATFPDADMTAKLTVTVTDNPIIPPDVRLYGDVDCDGTVTVLDATAIQRRLAELPTKAYNETAADVDKDGEVSILDATAIQRFLAELPTQAQDIGKPIKS